MSEKLFSMDLSAEERALINERRRSTAPTLPTAPYTVIKVQWRDSEDETNPVLMRFPPEWYGEWGWTQDDDFGDADYLARAITSFEVLAEPSSAEPEIEPTTSKRGLPRDEYTVIKVTWPDDRLQHPAFMLADGLWRNKHGEVLDLDELVDFEVLAEPIKHSYQRDTGMSHESFAESYPNEVQYHYDGGFSDGAEAALTRVREEFVLYMDQDKRLDELEREFGLKK